MEPTVSVHISSVSVFVLSLLPEVSETLLSTTAPVSASTDCEESVLYPPLYHWRLRRPPRHGVSGEPCAPRAPLPEGVLSSHKVAPPPRRTWTVPDSGSVLKSMPEALRTF